MVQFKNEVEIVTDHIELIEHDNGWFFSDLRTRVIPKGEFELTYPFAVEWRGFKYIVPKGAVIDFASIPMVLRPFFNRLGKSRKPAAIHDHMYETKWGTREKADKIFYQCLRGIGMSAWKARLYYWGVRAGGWTRGNW